MKDAPSSQPMNAQRATNHVLQIAPLRVREKAAASLAASLLVEVKPAAASLAVALLVVEAAA
jgi:hypothetical protein